MLGKTLSDISTIRRGITSVNSIPREAGSTDFNGRLRSGRPAAATNHNEIK